MLPPIFFKVPQAGATGAPDRISLFGLLTFCLCDLLFRAVGALKFWAFPLSLFPFFFGGGGSAGGPAYSGSPSPSLGPT